MWSYVVLLNRLFTTVATRGSEGTNATLHALRPRQQHSSPITRIRDVTKIYMISAPDSVSPTSAKITQASDEV
jgi:hypothetical protein